MHKEKGWGLGDNATTAILFVVTPPYTSRCYILEAEFPPVFGGARLGGVVLLLQVNPVHSSIFINVVLRFF